MGTFASETDVANSALVKVGRDLITSIDDDNERARVCKNRLPFVRDEVLRAHPWNFALKRVALAKTLVTPEFDYSSEFQIPNDVLRIIKTNLITSFQASDKKVTTTFGSYTPAWIVEGDKLLSNDDSVKILYIARVTDVSKWPSDFGEVVALRLAAETAYKFTNSRSMSQDLYAQYKEALAFARAFDAQEGDPDDISTIDWVTSRL